MPYVCITHELFETFTPLRAPTVSSFISLFASDEKFSCHLKLLLITILVTLGREKSFQPFSMHECARNTIWISSVVLNKLHQETDCISSILRELNRRRAYTRLYLKMSLNIFSIYTRLDVKRQHYKGYCQSSLQFWVWQRCQCKCCKI